MEVLIGVDVGSTNIKCAAIDTQGSIIKLSGIPTCRFGTGRPEAAELFGRTCDAIRMVTEKLPDGTKILGIASSSVGCSAILLDQSDHEIAISPPVNFSNILDDCSEATGYPPEYHNSGALMINSAERLSNVAHVLSIADYIAYRLSGAFARDQSTAGSMSMYDRRTGKWWDSFKKESGLSDNVLGKVYPSGTRIGSVTDDAAKYIGIPEGVPVSLGGHDYLCAAFALGCTDAGSILNVLGTFEMTASFSRIPFSIPHGMQVFSDCHCYPGRYSLSCESLAGGQLEWLRNNLAHGFEQDYWENVFSKIEALPRSFEGGGNEIYLPKTSGEWFPNRDPTMKGGFIGLTLDTDHIRLIRAAIEGLCLYSRKIFEFINPGEAAIVVAGGGSRQSYWLQTKADVLGCQLTVPQVPEAAAIGAALLAGVGSGIYTDYDEASMVFSGVPKTEFYPNSRRVRLYDRIYKEIFLPMFDITSGYDKISSNIMEDIQ